MACARCHDHKFDPVTTRDFYALSGFLQSSRRQDAYLDPHGRIESDVQELQTLVEAAEAIVPDLLPPAEELKYQHPK